VGAAQAVDGSMRFVRVVKRSNDPLKIIEDLFAAHLDLLDTKLAIDTLADPALDSTAAKPEYETLAAAAKIFVAPATTSQGKLKLLRQFIYDPGPGNNSHPFAYDMSDPLGHKPRNRILATYLSTRRGNCVTMPLLFVLLGRELG
jgi:regulator of sirC expression with transglutaminase-like and TPR domain